MSTFGNETDDNITHKVFSYVLQEVYFSDYLVLFCSLRNVNPLTLP